MALHPASPSGPQWELLHHSKSSLPDVVVRCIKRRLLMPAPPRILFCNCTYAQVVPREVKEAVLNMRIEGTDEVCAGLFSQQLKPNLPEGKAAASSPPAT